MNAAGFGILAIIAFVVLAFFTIAFMASGYFDLSRVFCSAKQKRFDQPSNRLGLQAGLSQPIANFC